MVVPNETLRYQHILMTYTVPVIFSLVMFLGILGNLLVVLVIMANIQMQNTTNILIISLALADILFIMFVVPFTGLIYFMKDWIMGQLMCSIHGFMTFATTYSSVYTLVLMSFDRYLAVVYAVESISWRTCKNTVLAVCCVWLASFLFNLPVALDYQLMVEYLPKENRTQRWCLNRRIFLYNATIDSIASEHLPYGRFYHICFFAIGYLIPLCTIVVLYGFLVRKLLFGRAAGVTQSIEALRSKRRVTRMVVIVVIVFALCWGPLHCIFLVQFVQGDSNNIGFRTAHILSQVFAYANSCMNPILYAFLSDNFRRAFAKFLCLRMPERNSNCNRNSPAQVATEVGKTKISVVTRSTQLLQMHHCNNNRRTKVKLECNSFELLASTCQSELKKEEEMVFNGKMTNCERVPLCRFHVAENSALLSCDDNCFTPKEQLVETPPIEQRRILNTYL